MYDLTLIITAKNEKESMPKVISELNNKYKIKVVLQENDYETTECRSFLVHFPHVVKRSTKLHKEHIRQALGKEIVFGAEDDKRQG